MTDHRPPLTESDLEALVALARSGEGDWALRQLVRLLVERRLELPTEDDEEYDFLSQPS